MKKTRKTAIGLLSFLLVVAFFSSCSNEQQIKQSIERFNQNMPKETGGGITIIQLVMDDSSLEYQCTLDEEQQPMSVLKENATEYRNGVIQNLYQNLSNPAFREIIEFLVETDRSLSYSIKGKEDTHRVNISPGELQRMLNGEVPNTVTPSLDKSKDTTESDSASA